MTNATDHYLRNHSTSLPGWASAGAEIVITRDRRAERVLTAGESSQLICDAASQW